MCTKMCTLYRWPGHLEERRWKPSTLSLYMNFTVILMCPRFHSCESAPASSLQSCLMTQTTDTPYIRIAKLSHNRWSDERDALLTADLGHDAAFEPFVCILLVD